MFRNLFGPRIPENIDQAIKRVRWNELEDAYGPATEAPAALKLLADRDQKRRAEGYDYLFGSIYHQGSVYSATVEAVSILILMVSSEAIPDRHALLYALLLMYSGIGFYDAHSSLSIMGDTSTADYQRKVADERDIVRAIHSRIEEKQPELLNLLDDADWKVRGAVIRLLCAFGTKLLPLYKTKLRKEKELAVCVLTAYCIAAQEQDNTPPELLEFMVDVLANTPEELCDEYREMCMESDLTADLADVLGPANPANIRPALDKIIVELQSGPDITCVRLRTILSLASLGSKESPFENPQALTQIQVQVVRECRRQLALEIMPGVTMSSSIDFMELLSSYGLPSNEQELDTYFSKCP